jgi:hypothetical protein
VRDDGPTEAWGRLFQVAGATAGLGALIYLIGSATLWTRFRVADLPADVAVEHETRQEMVSLGLRGILLMLALLAVLTLVIVAIGELWWATVGHRRRAEDSLIEACTTRLRETRAATRRRLIGVSVVIAIGVSFTTWRAFGMVVGLLVVVVVALAAFEHGTRSRPQISLGSAAVVLVACAVAGFTWQISGRVPVHSVIVVPPSAPAFARVGIPYFGETADRVYLGDIRQVPSAGRSYTYCHRILEVPRKDVRLIFEARAAFFNNRLHSPFKTLLDMVGGHAFQGSTPAVCDTPPPKWPTR